jgi:hypothetical protein
VQSLAEKGTADCRWTSKDFALFSGDMKEFSGSVFYQIGKLIEKVRIEHKAFTGVGDLSYANSYGREEPSRSGSHFHAAAYSSRLVARYAVTAPSEESRVHELRPQLFQSCSVNVQS